MVIKLHEGYLYKFINALIAFFLFLTANTVYWHNYNFRNKIFGCFIIICLVAIFYSFMCLSFYKRFSLKYVLFCLGYFGFAFLLFLKNYYDGYSSNLLIVVYILFPITIFTWIYLQFCIGGGNDLLLVFKNIVIFFALLSLFIYFLVFFFHISPSFFLTIDWGSQRNVPGYMGLFFNTQNTVSFLGLKLLRNSGIFTEAPMHSFVLTLALLIVLFIEKPTKIKKTIFFEILILAITLVTTTSTTGLFICILAFYFYFYHHLSHYLRLILGLLLPVVIIVLINLLISKYQTGYGSFSVRLDDMKAGYDAWINHPFLGNGWTNEQAIQQYMLGSRLFFYGNSGLSSGFFASLALTGGIQTIILFALPYVLYSFKRKKYAFPILLFILLINTIVNSTFIMITISMYMYASFFFDNGANTIPIEMNKHQLI